MKYFLFLILTLGCSLGLSNEPEVFTVDKRCATPDYQNVKYEFDVLLQFKSGERGVLIVERNGEQEELNIQITDRANDGSIMTFYADSRDFQDKPLLGAAAEDVTMFKIYNFTEQALLLHKGDLIALVCEQE